MRATVCPKCNATVEVLDDYFGSEVKCGRCGAPFIARDAASEDGESGAVEDKGARSAHESTVSRKCPKELITIVVALGLVAIAFLVIKITRGSPPDTGTGNRADQPEEVPSVPLETRLGYCKRLYMDLWKKKLEAGFTGGGYQDWIGELRWLRKDTELKDALKNRGLDLYDLVVLSQPLRHRGESHRLVSNSKTEAWDNEFGLFEGRVPREIEPQPDLQGVWDIQSHPVFDVITVRQAENGFLVSFYFRNEREPVVHQAERMKISSGYLYIWRSPTNDRVAVRASTRGVPTSELSLSDSEGLIATGRERKVSSR